MIFYLGGNEAGYKTKRSLNTEAKRAKYRQKLGLYIHADTLLSKMATDVPCTWITGTWVSKVRPGYGKTNEEMIQVAKVLTEEAGSRCSMIHGTELMGKKEVKTTDGLHLDPKQSCTFGERVADRLNEQLVLAKLTAEMEKVKIQLKKPEQPVSDQAEVSTLEQADQPVANQLEQPVATQPEQPVTMQTEQATEAKPEQA